ncbi:unnamed protein product [Rhodiola kirilowii]
MGSSEPTLVPEWLRCNGHGNSGASAAHHSANSHSDAPLLANSARNRSSRTVTETDSPRATLDRSPSINSRRTSSNNGSSKHPYSSFSRSHRDKEREKERSGSGDYWDRDSFEPLGKDSLRRTRSMVSRKQGDSLPRRVASDPKNIETNNHIQRNGLATGDKSASSVPKVSFEKDFPSLGADGKQVPKVVRVASPGLTVAAQSLPIGSSALIGEGWSALAEVPVVIGINSSVQPVHQPPATSIPSLASSTSSEVLNAVSESSNAASVVPKTSGALGPSSGLNMAEALVMSPSVSRTSPQLSIETQRLEQMAIKKVRQLIPMTPAVAKVTNSSDKLKSKLIARAGEISGGTTKVGQHPPSSSLNAVGQSPRGGPIISDASKQSPGSKLFVLKPPWENGTSATSKDGPNPENGTAIRLANNLHPTPAASSAPVRSSNISKALIMERNVVSSLSKTSAVEKRSLSSQAKSRSDFFNSVRKKTLMATTAATSDTSSSIQSPSEEKSDELLKEMASVSPCGTANGALLAKDDSNSEDHKPSTRDKNSVPCAEDIPDEEEAAFLRSLGWEENCEEEGLTEEEINAFYQEVMKSRPSLKLAQGVQPTLSLLTEVHAINADGSSPRLSSSDAAQKSN